MTGTLPASIVSSAPALIAVLDDCAAYRFFEFFTAQIRNSNTRRAYARAVHEFLAWCEAHDAGSIAEVQRLHVGSCF
jgi:integrase/recombinase XerD